MTSRTFLALSLLVVCQTLEGEAASLSSIQLRASTVSRPRELPSFSNNTRVTTGGELLVLALPVGQGDSTLVVCPEHNGNVLLVDMGSTQEAWSPSDVRAYLQEATLNGDRPLMDRLAAIVITHPDADHYNFLAKVFPTRGPASRMKPLQFEFPSHATVNTRAGRRASTVQSTSKYWTTANDFKVYVSKTVTHYGKANTKTWLRDVNAQTFNRGRPCLMEQCSVGNSWNDQLCGAGSAARFQIVAANMGREGSNNEQSVALKVTYYEHSVLLVGDLEGKGQNEILKAAGDTLKSEVYKISHHGSKGANRRSWLRAVQPSVAFSSSAYPSERYGHPRCVTMHYLEETGTLQRSPTHNVDCGKGWNDSKTVSQVPRHHAIYSTSPIPHHICLVQIGMARNRKIPPPQLVCWYHNYVYTRQSRRG